MMCERYDKKKVFYIFFFKCGGDIIEIPHTTPCRSSSSSHCCGAIHLIIISSISSKISNLKNRLIIITVEMKS